MKTQIKIALKFLLIMTLLTGVIYPLLMTGLAQLSYPSKANGSLIKKDGKIIGSELIGQKFDDSIYFWSRPSATDYNPFPSGASNLGPTSNALKNQVSARIKLFGKSNLLADSLNIPKEMIFASGSGVDPHISPEAAILQVDRIIKARSFDIYRKEQLLMKIKNLIEEQQYLFLGEKCINVLNLNLELDKIDKNQTKNN
jgi:potassium-transporting ATPase KdpC subunit